MVYILLSTGIKKNKKNNIPIFVFLGTASLVLVVMKLGASVALTTQPWWLFAWFGLVIGQNVGRIQPLGIVIQ